MTKLMSSRLVRSSVRAIVNTLVVFALLLGTATDFDHTEVKMLEAFFLWQVLVEMITYPMKGKTS